MLKFFGKMSGKSGMAPGTLVYLGEEKEEQPIITITVLDYDSEILEEKEVTDIKDCVQYLDTPTTTWINIIGIHDTEIIKRVGEIFNIHPLVLEDVLNTSHRPKIEEFEHYLYIVLKMLDIEEDTGKIDTEQVSIICMDNIVLTLQEKQGDVFNPIRKRIKEKRLRIRKQGTDYLTYALIDAIVDNYFHVLEDFGEQIEKFEDGLLSEPTKRSLDDIYLLKHDLIFLKKSVAPNREMLNSMINEEYDLISHDLHPYLRDVYDHVLHILEALDNFREILIGMVDTYNSIIGNRMNEVMKVLTIIATIFIPLTFIAGIYGMNFNYMPELGWKFGYFAVLGVMLVVAFIMIIYFRRKKWL